MFPRIEYSRAADGLYVYLGTGHSVVTDQVSERTLVDRDLQGKPIGIEFLFVSGGLDLGGIPQRELVEALLQKEVPWLLQGKTRKEAQYV